MYFIMNYYLIGAKTFLTVTTVSIFYFHHFYSLLSKHNFTTTTTFINHHHQLLILNTVSVSTFAFAWNINTQNTINSISTMQNISTGVYRGLRRSARLVALSKLEEPATTSTSSTSTSTSTINRATTALFSTSNSNSNSNKNRNNKRKKRSRDELTSENCNDTNSKDSHETKTTFNTITGVTKQSSSSSSSLPLSSSLRTSTLPRTREIQLLQNNPNLQIIGIDEAGRGPLAGPVVAASIILPQSTPTTPTIQGITDSKKLTKESDREYLYNQIMNSSNSNNNIKYAIAVVDSQTIDEINILQATLKAMSMVVNVLVDKELFVKNGGRIETQVSSSVKGCYVVLGGGGMDMDTSTSTRSGTSTRSIPSTNNSGTNASTCNDSMYSTHKHSTDTDDENISYYYALIDGNRTPKDLLCQSEYVIKGDSKEYCIGAASILAKVSRDRIMKEYDILYPQYELSRHKGKYQMTNEYTYGLYFLCLRTISYIVITTMYSSQQRLSNKST